MASQPYGKMAMLTNMYADSILPQNKSDNYPTANTSEKKPARGQFYLHKRCSLCVFVCALGPGPPAGAVFFFGGGGA